LITLPRSEKRSRYAGAGEIRQLLKEIPLLFTFRSKKRWRNGNQRRSLFCAQSRGGRSGLVDVIDIELFNDEAQIRALVTMRMPRASK
jgi:3-dehydroquinate dehydratase-1